MKRSLLISVSAAALFVGAPAFAQNASTVNQGGTGNNAGVTQSRSVGADSSLVEQNKTTSGGSNVATVKQLGQSVAASTTSDSKIYQTGSSDNATVTQEAYAGPGVSAFKNESTITQAGTGAGNDAIVEQYGHNKSTIDQSTAGNTATVRQGDLTAPPGGVQPVGGDVSSVTQDGGDTATINQNTLIPATGVGNYGGNSSSVTQGSGSNAATVDQTGLSSSSIITQSGSSTAFVTQNGNSEDSNVNQSGGGTATVTQNGGENRSDVQQASNATATVTQSGTVPSGGILDTLSPPNNDSTVTQNMGSNGAEARVNQTGLLNVSRLTQNADATADVDQIGGYNHSFVTQNATDGVVDVNQGSDVNRDGDNKSTITQNAGALRARATVTQTNATAAPVGGYPSNDSTITQSGADGRVTVTQNGNDQTSNVTQTGAGANATVEQTGVGNSSSVDQSGAGAIATVEQKGTGNSQTTNQADTARSNVQQGNVNNNSSNNVATVNQNAGSIDSFSDINQNGNGNNTKITQSGARGDSFAYTTGNNNTVDVNQSGRDSVSTVIQYHGYASAPVSSGNKATVVENGPDNLSYIAQEGIGNTASATLSGTGDPNPRRSSSEEYGSGATGVAAQSEIWQIGNNNKATVQQISNSSNGRIYQGLSYKSGGLGLSEGFNNTATIDQLAGSNDARADIYQGGTGNTASVTQSASNSTSFTYQDGVGNSAMTDQQSGSGHVSNITQYADGNTANTIQNGTSNTSNVYQYSNGNLSNVNQGGSNNTATVTQGMAPSAPPAM